MALNFSGMMRGLGAGMVNAGALMEEQNKRNWEQQQLMLKLEREEHLQRLQMMNQQKLQESSQAFTGKENAANREMQSSQFGQEIGLKERELAQTGAYQQGQLSLEGQRLSASQQQAGAQEKRLSEEHTAKMDEYNKKKELISQLPPSVQAQVMLGIKPGDKVSDKDKEIADKMASAELERLNDPDNSKEKKQLIMQLSTELNVEPKDVESLIPSLLYNRYLESNVGGSSPKAIAPTSSTGPKERSDSAFIGQFNMLPNEDKLARLGSMSQEQKSVLARELGYGTVSKMMAALK